MRAFAHIRHGLKKVVGDGGRYRVQQGDVFNGLYPGGRRFLPFHNQTAAAVDLVFKPLDPARTRIRDNDIGLPFTEGPHGKHPPGGAHIFLCAVAARLGQQLTHRIPFFQGAAHHSFPRRSPRVRSVGRSIRGCSGIFLRIGSRHGSIRRRSGCPLRRFCRLFRRPFLILCRGR